MRCVGSRGRGVGGVDFGVINSVEVVCRDTWLRPGEGGGAKADDVTVPKKLEPVLANRPNTNVISVKSLAFEGMI